MCDKMLTVNILDGRNTHTYIYAHSLCFSVVSKFLKNVNYEKITVERGVKCPPRKYHY